ncbi:MAG: ABC transporter permease [Sterolibacterium sp.]|jgi:ABC-type nitrate/sulfonate/bicarbonate transport system permease component
MSRARRFRQGLAWHAASIGTAVALLAVWAVVCQRQWISPIYLPSPLDTWTALREGMLDGELARLTGGTIQRMIWGWALASALGMALGALIGTSAALRVWLQPTLEFLRPLPASAILPVAIAFFGLSPGMALFVIAFGAIWPVLLATVHGFASVEPRLAEVARVMGLSRLDFMWKIGLPNALPDALGGMRLSMTVALILAIVAEMLAGQEGLGNAILLAARSYRSADLFAGVALLGAIGLVSNAGILVLERKLLAWKLVRD